MSSTAAPRPGAPALTLDAGALVGIDRDDRRAWAVLKAAVAHQCRPVVPAPVVTEVWRSPLQANLARALKLCTIEPTDAELARAAGELLAATGGSDPVDAIVVASASRRGGAVLTADPTDLRRLASRTPSVSITPL